MFDVVSLELVHLFHYPISTPMIQVQILVQWSVHLISLCQTKVPSWPQWAQIPSNPWVKFNYKQSLACAWLGGSLWVDAHKTWCNVEEKLTEILANMACRETNVGEKLPNVAQSPVKHSWNCIHINKSWSQAHFSFPLSVLKTSVADSNVQIVAHIFFNSDLCLIMEYSLQCIHLEPMTDYSGYTSFTSQQSLEYHEMDGSNSHNMVSVTNLPFYFRVPCRLHPRNQFLRLFFPSLTEESSLSAVGLRWVQGKQIRYKGDNIIKKIHSNAADILILLFFFYNCLHTVYTVCVYWVCPQCRTPSANMGMCE